MKEKIILLRKQHNLGGIVGKWRDTKVRDGESLDFVSTHG